MFWVEYLKHELPVAMSKEYCKSWGRSTWYCDVYDFERQWDTSLDLQMKTYFSTFREFFAKVNKLNMA